MARIKCPNCGKVKTIKGRYDHHFDDKIECSQCGLKVSGFCWDYIHKVRKEKNED